MKEIIVAVVGSGALSAIISGVFSLIKDAKAKANGNDALILFLTAAQLNELGERYIERGEIGLRDLELFTDMYTMYKAKKGNGYIDVLKDKVVKLPIVKE